MNCQKVLSYIIYMCKAIGHDTGGTKTVPDRKDRPQDTNVLE